MDLSAHVPDRMNCDLYAPDCSETVIQRSRIFVQAATAGKAARRKGEEKSPQDAVSRKNCDKISSDSLAQILLRRKAILRS
jgi:hypothetical protein